MTVVLICIFIALIILFGKLFIIGIRIILPPKIDFYFFMAAILSISSLLGIISLTLMLIRLLKNLLQKSILLKGKLLVLIELITFPFFLAIFL